MRCLSLMILMVCAGLGSAQETLQTPKLVTPTGVAPVEEFWEAAYVKNDAGVDVKIGHVHMFVVPITQGKLKLNRTTKELRLTISRSDTAAEMKADVICDEDEKNNVRLVQAKLWLGKDRTQTITGTVVDDPREQLINVKVDGQVNWQRPMTWDPTCIGLLKEQHLLRDMKAKKGDSFIYRYFEPQVTNYVRVKVEVIGNEQVILAGGAKRELLKAVATPEPLKLKDDQKLQLPAATFWVDPNSYEIVKTEMDLAEIGHVTLLRTSKAAATGPNGQVPDLMKRQSIFLKQAIPNMYTLAQATYRVKYSGDAQPKDLVSADDRQSIANINPAAKTFDVVVTARRAPVKKGEEAKAGEEFTRSNYFINSDNELVKQHAKRAVGNTVDPWEKAKKIELWVRHNMRAVDYSEAMAPADHVAKTLSGDCTEFSMLMAAMCRAEKVPSRTAIGLVYVNNLLGRPGLAFHMWTEVFVHGQWLALDATRGEGSVGPGHIKITDASWDKIISFTPLLPVKGFIMANPSIEVLAR
jgi:hypothetical protein